MGTYRAFGLSLRAEFWLPGLTPSVAADPDVEIRLAAERDVEQAWSGANGKADAVALMHGGRFTASSGISGDRRLVFDRWATFHISADARTILCAPTDPASHWWRRELLDTVLWLCALTHGYEALHAGSVETPEGVVAVIAGSGGGKSSLTGALVEAGARFFSDDVLALWGRGSDMLAYPGPGLMNLPRAWGTGPAQQALGQCVAEFEDERWIEFKDVASEPRRLAAMVLLERGPSIEEARVEAISLGPMQLRPYLFAHPFLAGRERERFVISCDLVESVPTLALRAPLEDAPATLAKVLLEALPTILATPVGEMV